MPGGSLLRVLVVATLVWLLGMASYAVLRLGPEGALPLLDCRILGYHPEQVANWLEGLSDLGRSRLLGVFRWADTVLPLLIGATLALAAFAVRRPWLAALALVYVGLDLAENAAVAAILRANEADPALVGRASGLTVGKWAVLIPTLGATLWFWWRQRR